VHEKWKKVDYEYDEDDITNDVHHILLYFTDDHKGHDIKWIMHEWCEENIGVYADNWHSNMKQIPKPGCSHDQCVAYIFKFRQEEDAMAFKLRWL